METVVTYRLAYLDREVTLCDACVERGDHGRGALGPVQHGAHRGECEGKRHPVVLTSADLHDHGFVVPPECQGQAVEVAYCATEDGVARRTTDRSYATGDPRRTAYAWAPWDALQGECEPWNCAPDVDEDAWRPARIVGP